MPDQHSKPRMTSRQLGMTLVELLVALAISSFLITGAMNIYADGRQAFAINESIARVQETAQFAIDTLEADLRMAGNWGLLSQATAIDGRSLPGIGNPRFLPAPTACGVDWALDLSSPVTGNNNLYELPCAARGNGGAMPDSDTITVRRATRATADPESGRLQILSTRIQGWIFADGATPTGFTTGESETHNLLVHSYYVAQSSRLIPGVPTLRRKTLVGGASGPRVVDQEIIPGVENLQLQLGIDLNQDNAIDRYVNPGDAILTQFAEDPDAAPRVLAVRLWLMVRSVNPEAGLEDVRSYRSADVDLGVYSDSYRRMLVSKTILLRNSRRSLLNVVEQTKESDE